MSQAEQREEAVFEAALQLPAEQRAAYLDQTCAGDAGLRQRVEVLLGAFERAGGFLKQPAIPVSARTLAVSLPLSESVGTVIGRYKLLEKLGEGGFGSVWLAEQKEPVRRKVALKVIKLGMDTKQVIARFEAERQALALMDHPNIAKVLDGGATEQGRPYFVMELVRGIPITKFCDENKLATRERLDLFIKVCHAVQHAHQKGIIHRDIKPSNVMVTLHDGVPVPKVIDFGIAKATQQELTDKTIHTLFQQFIGTPAYVSPEQAEMSGLDIDTRSDIYSLGVLLYELLAGSTPFDAKELMASGLDAMRKTIREQEPVRPSTKLSQTLVAADVRRLKSPSSDQPATEDEVRASSRRLLQIEKTITLLKGDLDWIVMKALEKDRARRYETANGLAADLTRHLNDEPVVARPPSRVYEFQKMVRRHKFGFAAAAAILLVLAGGITLTTWQAVRATRAENVQRELRQQAQANEHKAQQAQANEANMRQRAEANEKKAASEAAKSQQVAEFMKDMLKGVGPSVALGRDTAMLREILDKTAERIGTDLTNQPDVEVELRAILTLTYEELGVFKQREKMARETLRVSRSRLGEEHPSVADALHQIGDSRSCLGDQVEGEKFMREAVALKRKLLGNEHPSTAASLNVLAWVLMRQNKLVEAEMLGREALAIRRKLFGNEHRDVADSINLLARVMERQDKLAEAEAMNREALAMERKVLGEEHPTVAESLNNLAVVLRRGGKLAEAETMHREALARMRKLFSPGHPAIADVLRELVAVLRAEGKLAEVETLYREVSAGQRAVFGNESAAVVERLSKLAASLYSQGKPAEAEKTLREARDIILKWRGQELAGLPPAVRRLAKVLKSQNKARDAEKLYEETIQVAREGLGESHSVLGELLHDYGEFLNHESKWEASAEQYLKSLPIRRAKQDDNLAWTLRNLGSVLIQARRPKDAEPYLRESLALYRNLHQREDIYGTAWTAGNLADALYQQRKMPEAEQVYREALVAYSKTEGIGGKGYTRTAQSLVRSLKSENKLVEAENLLMDLLSQQRQSPGEQQNEAILALLPSLAESTRAHLEKEEFARAEPLARECLLSREKFMPEDWLSFDSRSMLGGSLLGQKQYAAAEPLLLSGYEGMKQREAKMPLPGKTRLKEALQRLVKLYEETGRTGPATEWRQKLAESGKAQPLQPFGIPRREAQDLPNLIDLSAFYNAGLMGNWNIDHPDNDLAELPVGVQELAGTQFDVRGLIQLGSAGSFNSRFPEQATGLPTRPKARRVHFLHGVVYATDPANTVIGKLVFHYGDGTTQERPLVLGKDVLDWWVKPTESAAKDGLIVAWSGQNGKSRPEGLMIRLYKTTWENPTPEVELTSIDFVSAKRRSAPFLVAITVE